MEIFEEAFIGNIKLQNRIIRSAVFEGMADQDGFPNKNYKDFYKKLARSNIGAIITGFSYISNEGKAMHPGQAGIDSEDKVENYREITTAVHNNGGKIIMQIAHTGRQTKSKITGSDVVAPSNQKSFYFNEKPKVLSVTEIEKIEDDFADSAFFAKEAGFDGIQIHCAHGYLIHQFITPAINKRKDKYGVNRESKIGTLFLNNIIDKIKDKCGHDFPLLVKISGSDDFVNKFSEGQFVELIKFLNSKEIEAIEVSYGTMDYALNIFRGKTIPVETILKHNPIYRVENEFLKKLWKIFIMPILKRKVIPFSKMYNLEYCETAKRYTNIPIICVGGFRNREEMEYAVGERQIDFISMARPFVCEPDFVKKIKENSNYESKCVECNVCAVMVDSEYETRCWKDKE